MPLAQSAHTHKRMRGKQQKKQEKKKKKKKGPASPDFSLFSFALSAAKPRIPSEASETSTNPNPRSAAAEQQKGKKIPTERLGLARLDWWFASLGKPWRPLGGLGRLGNACRADVVAGLVWRGEPMAGLRAPGWPRCSAGAVLGITYAHMYPRGCTYVGRLSFYRARLYYLLLQVRIYMLE